MAAYPPSSSVGSVVSDTDEEEAKEKAKEILHEFIKNKARAAEVERQLNRAFEENEGLIRLLQDKKYEIAREKERHAKEVDHIKKINHELQQKVEASKHEIRKVAQTCAQRTADTAVHLQNKESEVDGLEDELLALKEQLREGRAENDRLRLEREELERVRGEVPEKAQQRIAELARRILEISKEKSAADQMIMEGNDKVAAAMKTVEEFRQMQRETDARLQETERAREGDRARYEATIRGLQQELEMQTTLYKKYVEKLGQSPSVASPVMLPTIPAPDAPGTFALAAQQSTAHLEGKLLEKDGHIKELQEALQLARGQLEDHWKSSIKVRHPQAKQSGHTHTHRRRSNPPTSSCVSRRRTATLPCSRCARYAEASPVACFPTLPHAHRIWRLRRTRSVRSSERRRTSTRSWSCTSRSRWSATNCARRYDATPPPPNTVIPLNFLPPRTRIHTHTVLHGCRGGRDGEARAGRAQRAGAPAADRPRRAGASGRGALQREGGP